MKIKVLIICFVCLGITGLILINIIHKINETFVNSTINKPAGAIKSSFNLDNNSPAQAVITISVSNSSKPSVKIISGNDPAYKGERKIIDPSLGNYIIELLFNDANVLNKVRSELKLETRKLHGNNGEIVQSVRLAYPPDDSMSVLYIGCNEEPKVILEPSAEKLKIKISK